MAEIKFKGSAQAGTAHHYAPKLVAFEFSPSSSSTEVPHPPQNLLIWIGGLGDGLLTLPYPSILAAALPHPWSLIQVLLSSSYTAWGTSSLTRDAAELAACIDYFRNEQKRLGKIVLMGHSTGCQDVMEYLVGADHETRPKIDGGILQASVSDREAMAIMLSKEQYTSTNALAASMVADGRGEDVLPRAATHGFFDSPVCARRWLSLASPEHDGADDYFSSDLSDEQLDKTFGSLPRGSRLCILYSGNDEYVPEYVDKAALVRKWVGVVKAGGGDVDEKHSGVLEGATHDLRNSPEDVVQNLVGRIVGFLEDL